MNVIVKCLFAFAVPRGVLASAGSGFLSRPGAENQTFNTSRRQLADCSCKLWCLNSGDPATICTKAACCGCSSCTGGAACSAPQDVAFGSPAGSCAEGETVEFSQQCTAQCIDGYVADVSKLTCSDGGQFNPPSFVCTGKTCNKGYVAKQHPDGPCAEGNPILSETSCTTQCKDGYVPSVPRLQCAGGSLTPAQFTCEPLSCSAPVGIENMPLAGACAEGTTIASGTSCTPQCQNGHWPSEEALQCTAGTLSAPQFSCVPKYAEVGTGVCVSDAWSGSRTAASGFHCQSQCDSAANCFFYSFDGASCMLFKECMHVDAGSPGYMTYRSPDVECGALAVPNDHADGFCAEGSVIPYGSWCTARCSEGYRPSVDALACGNGGFSPGSFSCIPKECAAPSGVAGSSGLGACLEGDLIESGARCTVSCAAGYWPNRTSLQCAKGVFSSPGAFSCVRSYNHVGQGQCLQSSWSGTRAAATEYLCQAQCDAAAKCNFFSFDADADPPCKLFATCLQLDATAAFETYQRADALECIAPEIASEEGADPHLRCDGERVDAGSLIAPGVACEPACADGFKAVGGKLTCDDGGVFSPSSYACQGRTCLQPKFIQNDHPEGPCSELGQIPHGGSCTATCQAGFTASVASLDCNAGRLSPTTFACDESKCVAPVVANAAASGACAEGSILNPKQKCTPTCAEGYWPSEIGLDCRYGELSPASFTCQESPIWQVEEQKCKDGCSDSNCRSSCESTWAPLLLRIAISDCKTGCRKEYYLDDEAEAKADCINRCRQPLQVAFETGPSSPSFAFYDWRANHFDCTDSDVFNGADPEERAGQIGCRWLSQPEKASCNNLCYAAAPTTVQVYKMECDSACSNEEVPGTEDEQDSYIFQCKEACWVQVAHRLLQEEQAQALLGEGSDESASSAAVNSLALKVVALEEELHETRDHLLTDMQQTLTAMMQSEFTTDENLRQMGGSGITKVRLFQGGSESYNSGSFASPNMLSCHNHANFDNTVGLGEFGAVMNGFAFRTRHNDYKLAMPASNTLQFHATEDIPFPDVPPAVKSKPTVEKQIDEMRVYFKAFKTQNVSLRDYRPYFRPALCYLEGAWEKLDGDDMVEAFQSDRHHIAATGWKDLVEKVTLYDISGGKDPSENIPWLPTRVLRLDMEDTRLVPWIGKWNYRLLCHPVDGDVETARIRLVRDKQIQYQTRKDDLSLGELYYSKTARFKVDPRLSLKEVKESPGDVVIASRNYLDLLMEQIPGKDNYDAHLVDDILYSTTSRLEPFAEGDPMRAVHGTAINSQHEFGILNTAYYSRYFGGGLDAMGRNSYRRGFNDPDFWAAMTTQTAIAEVSMLKGDEEVKIGSVCVLADGSPCPRVSQRWTYALPFELIYMTPLFRWNPYNIETKPLDEFVAGSGTAESPYHAANERGVFFRTPASFYGMCDEALDEADMADTDVDAVLVLDPSGSPRQVMASGQQIVTRCIPGVGQVRLRYIIVPLFEEGSTTWKEVQALEHELGDSRAPQSTSLELVTTAAHDGHVHEMFLTESMQVSLANGGAAVWLTTSFNEGHVHDILLSAVIDPAEEPARSWDYAMELCRTSSHEGAGACVDGHDGVAVAR